MRCFPKRWVFLCGVLASGILMAGTTNELNVLKASRAAEKTRIDNTLEQQKTNAFAAYRQSVDTQMLAVKQMGDLDGYLALQAEKKRLVTETAINTNDVPALTGLVAQYRKILQEASSAHDKSMIGLLRLYVGRLTTLMQNYTRTDRLDEAKTVRDELQVAKTELTFLEADAPAETTRPTPPAQPPSTDDPARTLPGTWTFTWRNNGLSGTDTIILNPDGTASSPRDGTAGTWEIKGCQCIIHWPTTDNTLTLSTGGKRMMGHNRMGGALTAVKTGP